MNRLRPSVQMNAQLLYVIAIGWFVAAVGCFMQQVGQLAAIFAAMGALHLIWAIVRDIKESKQNK